MRRAPKSAVVVGAIAALAAVLMPTGGAAAKSTLRASMNGNAEVPRGDTNGKGTARITTDSAKGRVCYSITLSKVGSVAMGHIHKGARGKAGPVSILLVDRPTTRPKGCVSADKALIRAVERHPSRYYVNVHNAKFPAGAVRGQLRG
jgi:hypothetical protein